MRDFIDIVKDVLDHVDTVSPVEDGLCANAFTLCEQKVLTREEYNYFINFIKGDYDGPRYIMNTEFFWRPGKRSSRIDYLKQLIDKL